MKMYNLVIPKSLCHYGNLVMCTGPSKEIGISMMDHVTQSNEK